MLFIICLLIGRGSSHIPMEINEHVEWIGCYFPYTNEERR